MRDARSAIALIASLALPAIAMARTQTAPSIRHVTTARISEPITIDGRADEAAWASADPASDFVQFEPDPGAPASERTVARVAYDDANLYVAIRLHDASPDSIVARLARRDQNVFSDWATVLIDSRADRRTAFAFSLNPAGLQRDELVFDDDQRNPDWDAVWEGAARRHTDGWTAEFRIPLSQLRFSAPDEDRAGRRTAAERGVNRSAAGAEVDDRAGGERPWGINFGRYIARRDETAYWSPIPRDAGVLVSRFGRLDGLRGLEPPRGFEIAPYAVARVIRSPGDAADPFYHANDADGSAGADLEVGVGSGLTLNATINPDFGQVEADPSVVNLTAFETFFPEKRPFFQEGSELFRIPGSNVLYSRRIGRAPQGAVPADAAFADAPDATTILGAAKLSGKTADGWSVGVLEAATAQETARYVGADGARATAEVEPATNYAAARIARDFRGGRTAVGGIFTATNRRMTGSAFEHLHSAAYVGGLDARHRFGDDRYEISGAVVGSHVRGQATAITRTQRAPARYFQRPDADHVTFDPTRATLSGAWTTASFARIAGGPWRWGASATYTSPGFEINDLGFLSIADRIGQRAFVRYVDFTPGGGLRRWSVRANQFSGWTTGGERLDANVLLGTQGELESGWGWNVWAMRHRGGIDPAALRGGSALVNPGRYMGFVSLSSDRREAVNGTAGVYWEVEDGTDGTVTQVRASVNVRPAPRLALSLTPSLTLNTNDWQYIATRTVGGAPHYVLGRLRQRTRSLEARLNYTLSPTLSLQVYAQPFIGTGEYTRLQTVRDPLAGRFADRFHIYGPDEVDVEPGADGEKLYRVAPGGDDAEAFTLSPDFSVEQFRSNLVLRWEYRPGSTLFLVWSQDRTGVARPGGFRLGRDRGGAADAPARNILLVKVSYWMGL